MQKKKWLLGIIFTLTLAFTINVSAETCEGVISNALMSEIKSVFRIIQIAAPVLLLLFTTFDFASVVFSDNKDGLDKAKKNFLKRGVAVLIIFFAPFIIELILDLINDASLSDAADCVRRF